MIREWGMAFIGGMIGVTAVLIAYAIYQGFSQADFRALIDSMLVPVPFGIMLGRIWNFLNQEIPGLPVATDFRGLSSTIVELAQTLHIFHVYDQVDNTLRRNPNILASVGEGLIVWIILVITRYYQYRKKVYHPGKITAYFLIAYSFIRFFLEYTRVDSSQEYIGLYTISQYFFIGFLVLGIGILIYTWRFKHIYSNTPKHKIS
jgi:phosphatidylglycerol---prolipoprotein diacylglyceryl transferase